MIEPLGLNLDRDLKWIVAIVAAILAFIEKSGIKWNPYSQLLKTIGRGINGELLKKIDVIEANLSNVKSEIDGLTKDVTE